MSEQTQEISCTEVDQKRKQGEKILLLDCREQQEYDLVAIEGATLLPMSQLIDRVGELAGKEADEIAVYCHHGMRSAQVVAWLRQQGFSEAYSMAGGIDAWAVEIEPGMVRY